MSAREVVVVDGIRTPFAKEGTDLRDVHPVDLGQTAAKELLLRCNLKPEIVDEVIVGNTGNPADAVNISRVIALRAGLSQSTSAFTVHRNCASALESVTTAFDRIKSGTLNTVLAGGTENMSQLPFLVPQAIQRIIQDMASAKTPGKQLAGLMKLLGADLKQLKELITVPSPFIKTRFKPRIAVVEGLTDPFVGLNMGQTAEILAKEFGLSREAQDAFALLSHQKAVRAMKSGRLAQEITPVFVPPKFEKIVAQDVGPREDQSKERLAKLKPVFDRNYGSITAGNSCMITDGAAMVLVMERGMALAMGYKPLAKIRSYAYAGLEPERMGLGPAYSTPLALKRAGLTMKDIGLVELNEAFAAQVMACQAAFDSDLFAKEKLGLSQKVGRVEDDKVNVNGGAIALGHPVGATGTRLILTLAKEMQLRNVQFGLATLCIGGGQGGSVILEREA